jgi:hypothetical protein
MPEPVPPPPPQPNEMQTRTAVRLIVSCIAIAALLFLAVQPLYRDGAALVLLADKTLGAAAVLHKAAALSDRPIRNHASGKIMWLLGSSILRNAFDELEINRALEKAESDFRVLKFGQTRGASMISYGLARKLPIQAGDIIVHSVTAENFHLDWVNHFNVDPDLLNHLIGTRRMWQLPHFEWQKKLELTFTRPTSFFANHRLVEKGLGRLGRPLPDPTYPKHFADAHLIKRLAIARALKPGSKIHLSRTKLSFKEPQFNALGLRWLRELARGRGAKVQLIYIPPRCEYDKHFMARDLAEAWAKERIRRKFVDFPRAEEAGYADMTHPNAQGRTLMSDALIKWVSKRKIILSKNKCGHSH